MGRNSFATRLSRKIVFGTSAIFVISLIAVSVISINISQDVSVRYATELLKKTIAELENPINLTERITDGVAQSIEEFNHAGSKLDSSNYYHLLERSVKSSPYLLGIGAYYEPGRYDSRNGALGLYVSQDQDTGEIYHEWEDGRTEEDDSWTYFDKKWYCEPRDSKKPEWFSPFMEEMDAGDSLLITTYSVPLLDASDNVFGICTADLSLSWLKDKLESLKPYPRSNITIVDNELNFICNPMAEKPFQGSMYDTPFIPGMSRTFNTDEAVDWIWDEMEQEGSVVIHSNGKYAFLVFGVMNNGWTVSVNSLYLDAFRDVMTLLTLLVLCTLCGLAILFFSCRRTISKEAAPVASELEVSKNIQTEMLSRDFPDIGRGGIYASSSPAKEVGGDLYDFVVTDREIYFILGDVSGKGVPAALLMAITIAAFRTIRKNAQPMEDIVELINSTFCKSSRDMMFVTLVVGKIDRESGKMEYCNAGHNPMLYISADGKAEFIHSKTNLACGVMDDFAYSGEEFTMEAGSRLLVYSDGITEAERGDKEQFGEDRLIASATAADSSLSNENLVNTIISSVKEFTAGNEPNDDMTLMSISI